MSTFDEALDAVMEEDRGVAKDDSFDKALGEVLAEDNENQRFDDMASDQTGDNEELKMRSQQGQLAKEVGIAPVEVELAKADGQTDNAIRMRARAPEIKRRAPKVWKWSMKNPDNMAVIETDPDGAVRIEREQDGYFSTMGKILKNNSFTLQETGLMIQLESGYISPTEFAEEYDRLQNRKRLADSGDYAKEDREHLAKVITEESKEMGAEFRAMKELRERLKTGVTPTEEGQLILESLKRAGMAAKDAFDIVWAWVTNPAASTLTIAESAVYTGVPIATGIAGGAVGSLAGPAGATAGAFAGAGAASGPLMYSSKMVELIEEARAEQGAGFNLTEFMKTPAWGEARKEALAYAGLMAAFEGSVVGGFKRIATAPFKATAKEAGKEVVEEVSKRPIRDAVKGVVANSGKQGLLEARQELAASALSPAVTEEGITPESLGEAVAESTVEFLAGGTLGGGLDVASKTVGTTAKMLGYDPVRRMGARNAKTIVEGKKGTAGGDLLTRMGEAIKEFQGRKDFEEKTEELVEEVAKTEEQREADQQALEEPPPTSDDLESISEAERDQANRQFRDTSPTVSFRADQLATFANHLDIDMAQLLHKLGQDAEQDFNKAVEWKGEVTVPMARWLLATEENPELQALVKLGDNEFSALEGESILAHFEENPMAIVGEESAEVEVEVDTKEAKKGVTEVLKKIVPPLFKKDEEPPPLPPLPPEEPPPLPPVPVEPKRPRKKLEFIPIPQQIRDMQQAQRFFDPEHQRLFENLREKILEATEGMAITPEQAHAAAEIEFHRRRYQSQALDLDLETLVKSYVYTSVSPKEMEARERGRGTVLGFFSFSSIMVWGRGMVPGIVLRRGKSTDASTLFHEMAHSWFFDLMTTGDLIRKIPEAEMTPLQKEYLFAVNETMKMVGATEEEQTAMFANPREWADENFKRYQFIQETFAQTAEKYFLEGKFKNTKIQKLMEVVRSWMQTLWNAFREVGEAYRNEGIPALKVTPEVERVFEAILGINEKLDLILYPKFPPLSVPLDQLPKQGQAFVEGEREIQLNILAEMYRKSYRKSWREREKIFTDMLESMRGDVKQEYALSPNTWNVYKIYETFVEDKVPRLDGNILKTQFKGVSRDAVYGFLGITEDQANQIFTNEETESSEDVLWEDLLDMGIVKSHDQFFEDLKRAIHLEAEMEQQVQEELKQREPLFKTDAELEQEAVEAVGQVSRTKIFNMELKFMAEKALTTLKRGIRTVGATPRQVRNWATQEYIDSQAQEIVSLTPIKTNPMKLLNQSHQHQRMSTQLFARGDFVGALEAKFQQAKYFRAFEIYTQARRKAQKTFAQIKRLNRFGDKRLAKTYEIEYIHYLKSILDAYEKGQELKDIDKFSLDIAEQLSPQQRNTIAEVLREMDESRIMTGPKGMTVEQAMHIGAFVDLMIHLARGRKQVEWLKQLVEKERLVQKAVKEIGPRRETDPADKHSIKMKNFSTIRTIFGGLMSEDAYAKSVFAEIHAMAAEGSANLQLHFNTSKHEIARAMRKANKAAKIETGLSALINPILRAIPVQRLQRRGLQPIEATELGVTFEKGKQQVLMLIAMMGSKSGAEKAVMGGYKNTPFGDFDPETGLVDETKVWAFINRLIDEGVLIKEDFELVQTVWDAFAKHHEKAKAAYRYTDGVPMGTIAARPMTNKLGTWTGGYVPVIYDPTTLRKVNPEFNLDGIQGHGGGMLYPRQNTQFTKARVPKYRSMEFDLSKITLHLLNQLKVAYLRVPMYKVGQILGDPELGDALNARRPGIVEDVIIPWYDRVIAQQYAQYTGSYIDNIARTLRRNGYVAVFSMAWTPVVKQLIGLAPGTRLIGKSAVLKGLLQMRPGKYQETLKTITEKSVRMKERFANAERNLLKSFEYLETNQSWVDQFQEGGQQLAFMPIQIAQRHVDASLWWGAFHKKLGEGLTEREAISYADDVVERTQGATNIASMTKLQIGSDTQKIFTMFSTPAFAQLNQWLEEYARTKDENGLARAKALGAVAMYSVVITGILTAFVNSLRDGPEDEDELKDGQLEAMLERYAVGVGVEALQVANPIFGTPIANALAKRPTELAPLVGIVRDFTALRTIPPRLGEVDMNARDFSRLMMGLSLATGIPFTALAKIYRISENFKSDEEKRVEERQRRRQLRRYLRAQKNK